MLSMKLSRNAFFNLSRLLFIAGSFDIAGSNGAITGNVKGIVSAERTDVGAYTLTFSTPVASKIAFLSTVDGATAASGIMKVECKADFVDENKLHIVLLDATGVAADVSENSKLGIFGVFRKK